MTEQAVVTWRDITGTVAAERRGAERVKAAVATVHWPRTNPGLEGAVCAWCLHPWPCKTAQVVGLDEVLQDRERIARRIEDIAAHQPHRELLRPFVMQMVGIIRRGGGDP